MVFWEVFLGKTTFGPPKVVFPNPLSEKEDIAQKKNFYKFFLRATVPFAFFAKIRFLAKFSFAQLFFIVNCIEEARCENLSFCAKRKVFALSQEKR